MRDLKVWDEARTSHFELLGQMQPSKLIYRTENYSFDAEAARKAGAERSSVFRTFKLIALGNWRTVELNEPTMVKLWPLIVLYYRCCEAETRLRASKSFAYAVCIDNADVPKCVQRRLRIPPWLTRTIIRILVSHFDRVAFGTTGARDAYLGYSARIRDDSKHRVFEYVPAQCDCGDSTKKVEHSVLFVSSFETRKGVAVLKDAWTSPT